MYLLDTTFPHMFTYVHTGIIKLSSPPSSSSNSATAGSHHQTPASITLVQKRVTKKGAQVSVSAVLSLSLLVQQMDFLCFSLSPLSCDCPLPRLPLSLLDLMIHLRCRHHHHPFYSERARVNGKHTHIRIHLCSVVCVCACEIVCVLREGRLETAKERWREECILVPSRFISLFRHGHYRIAADLPLLY